MTFLEVLGVDVFGLAAVFAVLVALSIMIKLISLVFRPRAKAAAGTVGQAALPEQQYGEGELKLIDVDEKAAAAIMAIVSKESGIPLSRLRFNSIKRINAGNKEAGK
jgi:Na+-transporting methylmalonyl-CoA/oxaloacetate decarboxylase gamma subunit